MGCAEVKPEEPESLNQQSSLAEKVQEGACLGKNTTSAEEDVKEESKTEVENNSKFTGTNTVGIISPTANVLECFCRCRKMFHQLFSTLTATGVV